MSAEAIKSKFRATSGKSSLCLLFSDFSPLSEKPPEAVPILPSLKKHRKCLSGVIALPTAAAWGRFKHKAARSDTDRSHLTSTYSTCPPNYCPRCAMEASRRGVLHPLETVTSAFSPLGFWIASSAHSSPCNIHAFLSSNKVWVGFPWFVSPWEHTYFDCLGCEWVTGIVPPWTWKAKDYGAGEASVGERIDSSSAMHF